jgi:hypothetical protein
MSAASPTTAGNAVRKLEYVGGFCSLPACSGSAALGASSAFAGPAAVVGSGQAIARTNVPVISSPTIRTADTLPSATCPTKALYGNAMCGVCGDTSDEMFHAITIAKTINGSGPKRYRPGTVDLVNALGIIRIRSEH